MSINNKRTSLGIFLAKYRVDKGYKQKDMARCLGISSTFLSAIEMGSKSYPKNFGDKLISVYKFTNAEIAELIRCLNRSHSSVKFVLANAANNKRELINNLYNVLKYLTDEDICNINNIINIVMDREEETL